MSDNPNVRVSLHLLREQSRDSDAIHSQWESAIDIKGTDDAYITEIVSWGCLG